MDKLKECLKAMQALKTKGKTIKKVFKEELDIDHFPQSQIPIIKTNDVVYMLIDRNKLSMVYTNLNSRFPIRSIRGN